MYINLQSSGREILDFFIIFILPTAFCGSYFLLRVMTIMVWDKQMKGKQDEKIEREMIYEQTLWSRSLEFFWVRFSF